MRVLISSFAVLELIDIKTLDLKQSKAVEKEQHEAASAEIVMNE